MKPGEMKMNVNIDFKTDNAAFEGSEKEQEISRILKMIVAKIEAGETESSIYDYNGNKIGSWYIQNND
jgi:hypothetical protein